VKDKLESIRRELKGIFRRSGKAIVRKLTDKRYDNERKFKKIEETVNHLKRYVNGKISQVKVGPLKKSLIFFLN
jgi:hypothetical protein